MEIQKNPQRDAASGAGGSLTDRGTVCALCQKHGFSLSKGFGQHFLVNPGICPKICDAAGIGPQSRVLEIGPGFGTLTRELAARAERVAALEVDRRLLPVLDETLAGLGNVQVIHGDVLKTDLAALLAEQFGQTPATVCANLPYNITSPIIMRLLEEKLNLDSITVMVQKEAAERMAAKPGSRAAGAISYAVHYYAQPQVHFTVAPGSFYPPPKVVSSVITLRLRESLPLAGKPERERRLFRLVRAAFAQRRKTFANAAAAGLELPKRQLEDALGQLRLSPVVRPEQLTLEDFIALEQAVWPEDM